MPSVHVALTAIMALALRGVWRWVGFVFFVVILIGSVRLGWHYALDGYVSLLVVLLLWTGTGRFTRWWATRQMDDGPLSR
jgi:membrane-associated phospholipid phosphatase